MRYSFTGLIVALAAVLPLSTVALGQTTQPPAGQVQQRAPSLLQRLSSDTKPAGPAPQRDLTGVWAGPIDSVAHNVPPMTPLGQKMFSLNRPEPLFQLAGTNDPLKTCDPLGFPRNVLNETRGIAFTQMPGRVVQLFQYEKVWREIWTDGRELPKNVGAKDGPDPRYYGYSVGHWDGDYTFVVDTVGVSDKTWLDKAGHPHSADMRVAERYTRVDHNTLEMTVTIDDPKYYTKPFEELSKITFKWIPEQEFEEQLCVPSEGIEYMKVIGVPSGDAAPAQ